MLYEVITQFISDNGYNTRPDHRGANSPQLTHNLAGNGILRHCIRDIVINPHTTKGRIRKNTGQQGAKNTTNTVNTKYSYNFV